jgi:uncharacterized damage-inducible protein DinB
MASGADWLPEFDQEMARTRKVLERVPEDRLTWRPHPKSWTLAELATHVAGIGAWTAPTLQLPELDMSSPSAPPNPKPAVNRAELLALFDGMLEGARAALEGAQEATFTLPWSLRAGEQIFFTLPRGVVLRTFVLNHLIHHRAQLEVYLRMNDVPLPAIYGPSADETGM